MNIICATGGLVKIEFPNQGLMDIKNAGFDDVMLDMSKYISGATLRNWEKKLDKDLIRRDIAHMKEAVEKRGIVPTYAMLPFLAADTKRNDLNDMLIDLCKYCIGEVESLGVKNFIAKPLSIGVSYDDEWEVNKNYYLELANSVTDKNSKILLVNDIKNCEGHYIRGLCSDAAVTTTWIDDLNRCALEAGLPADIFGFCMDVGAYNLCGINMQDAAHELDNRILATIIRANDGHRDMACIPFTCSDEHLFTTDWMKYIRGMREIGFDGDIIMDMTNTLRAVPSLIRPAYLAIGKTAAEYFKMQITIEEVFKKYDQIAVFGAGDLGRGFVRSYKDMTNILFICDNNEARWGTTVDGIEIKNPKEMVNVPENTGIFICNMYHREIEEQLLEMGVKNIESVDCEFLPLYNLERVGRVEVN